MTGFAHYTYDTIEFKMLKTTQYERMKVIDVINYPLYIIRKNNSLYTESSFDEFNNIEIDSKKTYENTIDDYIKFVINFKYMDKAN